MQKLPRIGVVAAALALAAALAPTPARAQALAPQVVHTGTGPTGYAVTFRIADPSARRMRIKGEWGFASPAEIVADPFHTSGPRPASQWRPGDVPLQAPNGPNANWPVADMTKDANGVWTWTTPLPSGVWSYQFYKDCDAQAPALTGCLATADPANPPCNTRGSVNRFSQIYVPSDPAF